MKFKFTVVENNTVLQSWQSANPDAKIVQMQFLPIYSEPLNLGTVAYTHHLGLIYTEDAV